MSRVIKQAVHFPVPSRDLFDTYLDAEKHAAAIGSTASVSREAGAEFRAYDGGLTGRNLAIVPGRLIVQSWRASVWQADDPDSVLILAFADDDDGGRIDLVQLNVPDHAVDLIDAGWKQHYWQPWRTYFEGRTASTGSRP
jgi:activator of HSP90 ATPase